MNDQGYTLTEMLAALVMIGLAVGGLTMGVRVIGHGEAAVARASGEGRALRNVQAALVGVLDVQGPFRTKDGATFSGLRDAFSFACGRPSPCGVSLSSAASGAELQVSLASGPVRTIDLPGSVAAHFVYVGNQTSGETWPHPPTTPDSLRSVVLVRDTDGASIASVHVWREQPADCAFDPVAGDCRSVTK